MNLITTLQCKWNFASWTTEQVAGTTLSYRTRIFYMGGGEDELLDNHNVIISVSQSIVAQNPREALVVSDSTFNHSTFHHALYHNWWYDIWIINKILHNGMIVVILYHHDDLYNIYRYSSPYVFIFMMQFLTENNRRVVGRDWI